MKKKQVNKKTETNLINFTDKCIRKMKNINYNFLEFFYKNIASKFHIFN